MSQEPSPQEPQDANLSPLSEPLSEVPSELTIEPVTESISASEPSMGEPVSTRSPLKTQTIQVLRSVVHALENVIATLEAEPTAVPVTTPSSEAVSSGVILSGTRLLARVRLGWQRLQAWWASVLSRVRAYLPEAILPLSDRALTGTISAIFVVLLWAMTGFLSIKPKPTPVVAVSPTPEPSSIAPQPTATPVVLPTPVPEASPSPTPLPAASPIPDVKPSPLLKRSPEQPLIAAIQDRVAEISNQYANGLLQSVQANFRSSRLTINVGEDWYRLDPAQQDKFANEVLSRAQELDFSQLELTDPEGVLLARSPVVGSEMIILRRSIEPGQQVQRSA